MKIPALKDGPAHKKITCTPGGIKMRKLSRSLHHNSPHPGGQVSDAIQISNSLRLNLGRSTHATPTAAPTHNHNLTDPYLQLTKATNKLCRSRICCLESRWATMLSSRRLSRWSRVKDRKRMEMERCKGEHRARDVSDNHGCLRASSVVMREAGSRASILQHQIPLLVGLHFTIHLINTLLQSSSKRPKSHRARGSLICIPALLLEPHKCKDALGAQIPICTNSGKHELQKKQQSSKNKNGKQLPLPCFSLQCLWDFLNVALHTKFGRVL